MQNELHIDKKLYDLCGRQNPFIVPGDYFLSLDEQIVRLSHLEKQGTKKAAGFAVRDQYFVNLPSRMQSQIALGKLKQSSFSVPETYFANLEENILSKLAVDKGARRETVVRRLFISNTWKYATAACVTLVAAFTFWYTRPVEHYNVQSELSALPVSDIENYLDENTGNNDMTLLMENIDHDLNFKQISGQVDGATLKNYIETQL